MKAHVTLIVLLAVTAGCKQYANLYVTSDVPLLRVTELPQRQSLCTTPGEASFESYGRFFGLGRPPDRLVTVVAHRAGFGEHVRQIVIDRWADTPRAARLNPNRLHIDTSVSPASVNALRDVLANFRERRPWSP
ncbi:MAG TPA: hypothetical protein VEA69_02985 [Tepidisphaeraceae bacterium]|nr:hypothetical protein [Tepidisphaeraceae bacterium]